MAIAAAAAVVASVTAVSGVGAGWAAVAACAALGSLVAVSRVRAELREAVHDAGILPAKGTTTRADGEAFRSILTNVSHEIRTSMSAILGMIDLLEDTDLTHDQREYLRTVESSSQGLVSVLNDVLDFSKIESGRFELEFDDFDLEEVLRTVSESMCSQALEKGIELLFWIAPEVPRFVRGDAARLRQILMNLVSNALRFTNEGHVRIAVEAEDLSGDGPFLRFRVEDTGVGISEAKLASLFRPAQQVDGEGRGQGGAGLGLTISRQLAEFMGGGIGIESVVGRGTTVWFTAEFHRTKIAPPREPSADELAGKRVLIAEGGPATRELLRAYAERWGVDSTVVPTSEEALAAVHRANDEGRSFDVVLLDADLRELDGFELATRIKDAHGTRKARLLLVHPLGRKHRPTMLVRAGFEAWITHPIVGSKLLAAFLHAAAECEEAQPLPGNADNTEELSSARRSQPPGGKSLEVLVVEDNVVNQKVTLLLLQKLGCRARVASDGSEAVHEVTQNHYDLVFMDCQMPVMSGFEATKEIRAAGHAHLPILAMTANAMPGDKERCLKAGMNDYMAKPVHEEDLRRAIEKWGGRRASEPTTVPAETHAMDEKKPSEILDHTVIQSLRELGGDDDPGLFIELVHLFLSDTPERMKQLEEALEKNDPTALEHAAHGLKSSAANLGAVMLSDLFKRIELAGKHNHLDEASSLVEESRRSYEDAERALRDEIE